jgi:hypothetical protein
MINFLFTEWTVEFLSMKSLMLKTLLPHKRDSSITTTNAIKTVFCIIIITCHYTLFFAALLIFPIRIKTLLSIIFSLSYSYKNYNIFFIKCQKLSFCLK